MSYEIINPSSPPEQLADNVIVSMEKSQHDWTIFRLSPQDTFPEQRIVYFHGGAFVWHMLERHWNFVSTVTQETNSEVIIPAYPLAPHGNAEAVLPHAAELVAASIETATSPVTLMGDSAGGNLAVVATMINRDHGLPLPARNILISPWLDLHLPDSDLESIHAPGMSVDSLRKDADAWRGELPLDHPYVSPVHDTLHHLGTIAIFCGTADVLNPGCRRFVEKASTAYDTDVHYYEYPDARHSHALGATAAGAHARAVMYEYMQSASF